MSNKSRQKQNKELNRRAKVLGKTVHFMYVPFTGLGLYNGFRGNRWLKNRIRIFTQFVLPSLLAQTNKDFILWISWRYEEKTNKHVQGFKKFLDQYLKTVFTYGGVMFWDDKYPDDQARERLLNSIHVNIGELIDTIGEAEHVIWTLQPSDDCYHSATVQAIKEAFKNPALQALGFKKGYVMDYTTKRLAEWNPSTNPPFFSINFPKEIFVDPLKHAEYTGPYKSHEYIGQRLRYGLMDVRGFVVGTHGENISTIFKHPFTGKEFVGEERDKILKNFGLGEVEPIKFSWSLGRWILKKMPYQIQRKLRYLAGEKKWLLKPLFNLIYSILRA